MLPQGHNVSGTYQLISLLERRLLHMESVRNNSRKGTVIQNNLANRELMPSRSVAIDTKTYHRVRILCQPSHGK